MAREECNSHKILKAQQYKRTGTLDVQRTNLQAPTVTRIQPARCLWRKLWSSYYSNGATTDQEQKTPGKHRKQPRNKPKTCESTRLHTQHGEAHRKDQRSCWALDAPLLKASIGYHPLGSIGQITSAKMCNWCWVYGCACCTSVPLPHFSPRESISPHSKQVISERDVHTAFFFVVVWGMGKKTEACSCRPDLIPRDAVPWR